VPLSGISLLLSLKASQWSAIGQVVLAVGAIAAAGWAAYTFRKAKRAEAARWMISLFKGFYQDEDMSRARELIEYDFWDVAGPLLELRVLDRQVALSPIERAQLRDLDLVLNFLEQLLYLQEEGHLLERDRNVFFEYWFDQLTQPSKAALRRYLQNCGYEHCSRLLGLESQELFLAYGSLLTGQGGDEEEEARRKLQPLGRFRVKGELYSRGEFPALVPGENQVEVELFRVEEKSTFRLLDELEHYDPRQRETSLYRRRCIHVSEPAVDAWIYYWNGPMDGLTRIENGSWTQLQIQS
jgi:gamma-glutamylcyclotransferase (GGCT)/AIG2-like uncharacterized protein YtfP